MMLNKNRRVLGFARFSLVALLLASSPVLSGCDMTSNYMKSDRAADMEPQDFRDGLAPRINGDDEGGGAAAESDDGIPALQSYVAQPSEDLKPMPLVSISVNQTVPLRDALYELAEQANYDVELDPRISGSVIFTAREKPLDIVVQRIAEIAGLRYKFDDGMLRVELDTPYNKVYKVDYLSYVRKNESSIRNDISVVTGQGTNTGSGFEAKGSSEADFWKELSENLGQILGVAASKGTLKTSANPQITAAEQNPAPVEPVVVEGPEGGAANGEGGAPAVNVQPPAAVLQVTPLPVDSMTETDAADQTGQGGGAPKSSFSVNRQGGMISVYATDRQHREIASYLEMLQRSVTAQVLIEAKVLQVDLTDEFATGIDWGNLPLTGQAHLDITTPPAALDPTVDPVGTAVQMVLGTGNVNALIDTISRFGTVRALSSPRLTVLNNQSAVLNVARNHVYFELTINTSQNQTNTTTTVDSDIRNVPEGVLINVQPAIDLDNRTISMVVRPTITSIQSSVADPAVAFAVAQLPANQQNITSEVPVVNVQEFDSLIKMNSGQAMVMGGLMQDRTDSTQQGIPVLKEVPLLGGLFRAQNDKVRKSELVVFLKATIIDGGNVHQTDKDLYRMFSGDRRPTDL